MNFSRLPAHSALMSDRIATNYQLLAYSLIALMCMGGLLPFPAEAQLENVTYNLISPLPGGTNQLTGDNIFPAYARQLFAFILSAAAVLAFLMLVVGGMQYLSAAGNESWIKDAKSRIMSALFGLVLAAAAWLILNTINPALISNDFAIPDLPVSFGSSTVSVVVCNDGKQGFTAGGVTCADFCKNNGGVKSCNTGTGGGGTPGTPPLPPPPPGGGSADCTTGDGTPMDTGCDCGVNSDCRTNKCSTGGGSSVPRCQP